MTKTLKLKNSIHNDAVLGEVETVMLARLEMAEQYDKHWTATILGKTFYLGTGYNGAVTKKSERKQYVVWYPNGKMWYSYGTTMAEALDGALPDAWKYF